MNKKALTEADIRSKFITPALVGPGGTKWDLMTQIREEAYFTKGRVIVRGQTVKRGEASKAMTKITQRKVDKAYEIYLCLYQAVTGILARRKSGNPMQVESRIDFGSVSALGDEFPWAGDTSFSIPGRLLCRQTRVSGGKCEKRQFLGAWGFLSQYPVVCSTWINVKWVYSGEMGYWRLEIVGA